MTFACPKCGQHLAVETMYHGQTVKCPKCGQDMAVPSHSEGGASSPSEPLPSPSPSEGRAPALRSAPREGGTPPWPGEVFERSRPAEPSSSPSAPPPPPADVIHVRDTLQSNIERAGMTISKFMASQQLEGGVNLDSTGDSTPSGSSASDMLTDEQGRKYVLGEIVAQGGMGAILDAKDANIRRHVAMKVMLNPKQATKEQILRFIAEAQVTGQLEHPSVVPVHELGVDASGSVFYTMKFVKGKTLAEILKGIREGDDKLTTAYPLPQLLTIFQKICDAMAFAHSRRVIHRDLKPDNVMVGEYGEVQVMDWGLAKVMPKKKPVFSVQKSEGKGRKGAGGRGKETGGRNQGVPSGCRLTLS